MAYHRSSSSGHMHVVATQHAQIRTARKQYQRRHQAINPAKQPTPRHHPSTEPEQSKQQQVQWADAHQETCLSSTPLSPSIQNGLTPTNPNLVTHHTSTNKSHNNTKSIQAPSLHLKAPPLPNSPCAGQLLFCSSPPCVHSAAQHTQATAATSQAQSTAETPCQPATTALAALWQKSHQHTTLAAARTACCSHFKLQD
jgi:hypothetical protein